MQMDKKTSRTNYTRSNKRRANPHASIKSDRDDFEGDT